MLINILIGVAVLVAVFLLIVALQASTFRIARQTKIAAPASEVFAQIIDFHKWTAWSPYEKLDPNMQRAYEGPPFGVGSIYSWTGNKNIGEGRCTIVEARSNELIRIKLEFFKPFTATNEAHFTLSETGGQTTAEWAMTGPRPFMFRAMNLILNFDKMCGNQFDEGLANLKAVVEVDSSKLKSPERERLAATR